MKRARMPSGGVRRTVGNFTANADMRFDEAVLADGTAARVVNFDVTDGALTDGYGIEITPRFEGKQVLSLWRFTRYDYDAGRYISCDMYCDADGKVYYDDGGEWKELSGVVFTSPPSAVGYRLYGDDSIIMTSPTDKMYVWDGVGAPRRVEDSPYITSMVLHYERMFATTAGESNAVYFSDDLDPTNWNDTDLTEGGFIQLLDERGRLLKVVDFLNYVYVFREYGISRLTAYADQEDFNAVNLYVAGGKIYEGGVCACGDTILLTGADGLYSFDGYSATRKLRAVKFRPSPAASAVYSDGKYYLAACTERDDGVNDTLVVYDISEGTFSLSSLPIARLCKLDGEVFAVMSDGRAGKVSKCGELFGAPLVKVWESGVSDFGSPDVKTVSEITLRTDGDITVTVECDGKARDFAVSGGAGIKRFRPGVSGRTIRLRVISQSAGARVVRLSCLLRSG